MVKPYIHTSDNEPSHKHACPQVLKRDANGEAIHTSDNEPIRHKHKMARAEKCFKVTTYTLVFITSCMRMICESKSAIHRSCYNIQACVGSFVGSFKISSVPRPFCSSLYVWTGLVLLSISN